MQIPYKFLGLTFGTFFTIACLILNLTYFIPVISFMPGVEIENLVNKVLQNDNGSLAAMVTIAILSLCLIIIILGSVFRIRKLKSLNIPLNKMDVFSMLFLFHLVIHPLICYSYWGARMHFRGDGQLIMLPIETFPISSFTFILFGLLIDRVKNI
jgi:hypothetical protein